VIGLTKSIAADYVKQGIPLQLHRPGTVDTPSLGDRINAFADPVQARKDFIARQPRGGWARSRTSRDTRILASDDPSSRPETVFDRRGMTIEVWPLRKERLREAGLRRRRRLRDLSKVMENIGRTSFPPARAEDARQDQARKPRRGRTWPRFGFHFIGIGKFRGHRPELFRPCKEAGMPIPAEPIVFMKATTCISGPERRRHQPGVLSTGLGMARIVIGSKAQYVEEKEALEYVAGYCW